ncbi:NUDIX hydrolase [Sporanaerobium hydrogeniformans]|uniref:NUDIX hydrolase n=1 Tax=Sporanaerobium hydrogeniformans TaxID=3072179 RepID=A0AC61D973_9FIRM|nr:NUDIX hydrolase [Sporanaerobium hydrogeniformans]PHV69825.1 NUDIX hydrolase [Sporanaerobium hydrogeniformans]
MNLRPRAAAIIINDKKELLVLKQKHPKTGFEWWTLPGGGMEPEESVIDTIVREVEEECSVRCRPLRLLYLSEYVDYSINTHHLGMFFLTSIDNPEELKPGFDPEVDEQYIQECRYISEKELKASGIPIFPPVFKDQFWRDLENNFCNHEVYQRGQVSHQNE